MSRWRHRCARWCLLGMLAVGCKGPQNSAEAIPTHVVQRAETFVRVIKAEGTLQAVKATSISPPAETGRPMRIGWLAEDGATVEKGEVVIRLDATELRRELDDSRDDMRASQRRMDKVDIERRAHRDARDATMQLSELEANTAREFKSDDVNIFSRAEIAQSEIDIELSDAKAAHAKSVKAIEGRVSDSEARLHRIAKDQAARQVKRSEETLGKLEIRAPHPGILIMQRSWSGEKPKVGDTVWPGQKIAELPLVAELEAKLFVLEADAGALTEGVAADVVVAARPSESNAGHIKQVDTLAQPRHPDVPVNYFGVTVALDTTHTEFMRVGQRVEATLRVEAKDAIVVPRQAVFDREGRRVVFKRKGDGFEETTVELGVASAGRVVLTSGLEAGDEVALRDPTKDADELLHSGPDAKDKAPTQEPKP